MAAQVGSDEVTGAAVAQVLADADVANEKRSARFRTLVVGSLVGVQLLVAVLGSETLPSSWWVAGVLGVAFLYCLILDRTVKRWARHGHLRDLIAVGDLAIMHVCYRQIWLMLPGLRPYDEMLARMPVALSV